MMLPPRVASVVAMTSFHLGLACLLTHELDAMTHHEWRVLPLTSWLPDAWGRDVFVVAHVPLFAAMLAALGSALPSRVHGARIVLAGFLVLHAGLHFAFTGHALYTFAGALSNGLIGGAALGGMVFLLLRRQVAPEGWRAH